MRIAPTSPNIDEPNKTKMAAIINITPATLESLNEYQPAIIPMTEPIIDIVPRLIVRACVKLPINTTKELAANAIIPPIVANIASNPL